MTSWISVLMPHSGCKVAASLLIAGLLVPMASAATESTQAHELSEGAVVEINTDGTLTVHTTGTSEQIILTIAASLRASHTLRRSDDWVFVSQRREGDDGGRRGFSPHADDDDDGRIDEERLDGRDNDGDGLIDEDFAAIGDDMTAVSFMRSGRALYLEAYHWDYSHLNSTLFTTWRREDRDGTPRSSRLLLELPYGEWQEMAVGWEAPHSAVAGDVAGAMMMVATLPRDGGHWWIGVTQPGVIVPGADQPGTAPSVDGRVLELPFDGTLTLAVTVTTTLTQLRYRQAVAHAVHAGAPAGPGKPAVAWIVPPLLQSRHVNEPLAGTWDTDDKGWHLDLEIPSSARILLDPETLRLLGRRLVAPARVSWRSDDEDEPVHWSAPWPRPDYNELWRTDAAPHPYRAQADRSAALAGGTLTFHYDGPPPLEKEELLFGDSLCGQTLRIEVHAAPTHSSVSNFPAGQSSSDPTERNHTEKNRDMERRPPCLSPDLLDNFPNPFRALTRLRYKIPATVGEGFVWDDDQHPTLKDSDPVPYASGTPSVSLRIYSVAGHEVVTLFDGSCTIGTYEAVWDGTDLEGRPVAVGTYFCKLQIENWSVTKRVALVR